jgi:predicted transcriptional regulator of viral defense system
MESKSQRILSLAARQQIIRSKDASALGIPRNYLSRFVQRGLLRKVGRGLYASPSSSATEHISLIEAAYKVPDGVICLLSALQFHKFTTQAPYQVWIAIDVKAWAPQIVSPATRLVRMSGPALHFGVKEYPVHGATLKVYTPAKTVADCFKFRNKIGMDVALEALRECRRLKKATTDEIWSAAKVCRVANVMRPYLESPQASGVTLIA